jgi:hypothetical protein
MTRRGANATRLPPVHCGTGCADCGVQCRRIRLFGDAAALQALNQSCSCLIGLGAPTAKRAVQPTGIWDGSRLARVLVASPQRGSYGQ